MEGNFFFFSSFFFGGGCFPLPPPVITASIFIFRKLITSLVDNCGSVLLLRLQQKTYRKERARDNCIESGLFVHSKSCEYVQ